MRGLAALSVALCAVATGLAPAGAVDLRVRVLDNAGAPLPQSVVYAVPARPLPRGRPPAAIIDQVHRQFVPRVSVVQVGTAIDFPNSDNIRHSVYSFSPAKVFVLKLYAGRAAPPVVFDKPGIIVLGCEIHDSMIAWLLVVDTPYYGKSDARGLVTLRNLPPGHYALHAWHEPLRQESAARPLLISAGGPPPEITIRLDPGAAPGRQPGMADMPGMSP
jgi:hypothetical protein